MTSERPEYREQFAANRQDGGAPISSLISAMLFLYVGFWLGLSSIESDPLVQRLSIHVFVWMARVVGIGLLAAALLEFSHVALAEPLNFGLSAVAALVCLACGAIWVAFGFMFNGLLALAFGAVNAGAARNVWRNRRRKARS